MRITFDRHAKIAGIGIVPWSRVGLEQWFDSYKITSLYNWDIGGLPEAPEVLALANTPSELIALKRWNTQALLDSDRLQQLLAERLAGYNIVTYKPVRPPRSFSAARISFSCSDQVLAQRLENKVEFRGLFSELGIPFPAYQIQERHTLTPTDAGLAKLLAGREAVVVQDEALSGGKGTYIIRSTQDLQAACSGLAMLSRSKCLVVSDLVSGARERSVQAVVTKHGIFVGPLQKQIVRHPLLANMNLDGSDRFCGGEISPHDPLAGVYSEIRGYALKIGKHIQSMGYKGIFGIDCLVDARGKVFVLEINPRITGLTPLLTQLYRPEQDIPFYLLHVLELAGLPYELSDSSLADTPPEGGLFLLHSLAPSPVRLTQSPASGLYDAKTLTFDRASYLLRESVSDQLLVQQYMPPHFTIGAGGRILAVYAPSGILTPSDTLRPEIEEAVHGLHERLNIE